MFAEIAQLVERRPEEPCVRGSNPRLGTSFCFAGVVKWYTRSVQVAMAARPWRFKSSRPHHM